MSEERSLSSSPHNDLCIGISGNQKRSSFKRSTQIRHWLSRSEEEIPAEEQNLFGKWDPRQMFGGQSCDFDVQGPAIPSTLLYSPIISMKTNPRDNMTCCWAACFASTCGNVHNWQVGWIGLAPLSFWLRGLLREKLREAIGFIRGFRFLF